MRDLLEVRPLGERFHALGDRDRLLPVFLLFEDLQQEAQRLQLEGAPIEASEKILGTVEQSGTVEVLRELEHGDLALLVGKIGSVEQVLMHANGAIDFALLAEQVAEREMQIDRLGIDLHDLDERFDCLVRLLVKQEIEPPEVG